LPTVTHATAGGIDGFGCAVSLQHGVYWVGGSTTVRKHNLTDGAVLATINVGTNVRSIALSVDRKFLLTAGTASPSIHRLTTVDAETGVVVDTGARASDVSVCDDGTIISAAYINGVSLVSYNINSTGHLTQLHEINPGAVFNTACSPDSAFVLGAIVDYLSTTQVHSFKLKPLQATSVDTLALPGFVVSLTFNRATSVVYFLQASFDLVAYAFNSDGTFGALVASATNSLGYSTFPGVEQMQFAYDKLLVLRGNRLLTYDAALNLLSNEKIADGTKTEICVSESMIVV
jgi:hypothetical protein